MSFQWLIQYCFLLVDKPDVGQRLDYFRSKYCLTRYIRIICVFYTIGNGVSFEKPLSLSCKTFVPSIYEHSHTFDKYEPSDVFFKREIMPFICYNSKTDVINFEIVPYFVKTDVNEMKSWSSHMKYRLVLCFRIYFNGPVENPPVGYIQPPPSPLLKEEICCSLS